jgi:hypothetical protein
MKKYLCLFLLLPLIATSQKIEGIGDLKIGKTTIATLPNDAATKEILRSENPDDYDAPYSKLNKCYKLYSYAIAGITIDSCVLKFLKDTLIEISITDPSESFTDAVATKYKVVNVDKKEKKSTCTSAMAGNYTVSDINYTTYYRKDNIEAVKYLSSYYDSKCKKQYFNLFYISDTKRMKQYSSNDKTEQAKIEKSEKSKKLKELSKF